VPRPIPAPKTLPGLQTVAKTWCLSCGSSFAAFTDVVVELSFVNPNFTRDAMEFTIAVSTTAGGYSLNRGMEAPEESVLGVVDGGKAFRAMTPTWTTVVISQTVPFLGRSNTLTLQLQSTINLRGDGLSVIIVSGLEGAVLAEGPVAVSVKKDGVLFSGALFCVPFFFDEVSTGSWSVSTRTLTLSVCSAATFEAVAVYEIMLDVVNPSVSQPSPAVTVSAAGTVGYDTVPADKLGAEVFGVAFGADPLKVILLPFMSPPWLPCLPAACCYPIPHTV